MIQTPQYDRGEHGYQRDPQINIAEIADGFLNSPLMTQFSGSDQQMMYTN